MTADQVWALVPVKRFAAAKTRLAHLLTPSERARLARAMLTDVLDVLAACTRISGTLVVTEDADAAQVAEAFAAQILREERECGLNAAVERGLRALHHAHAVVILPADLPCLSTDEIDQAIAALDSSPLVLVPASRDGGTNLIAARPPSVAEPAFGEASFVRHVDRARYRGVEPCVLRLPGTGHDVDRPEDLVGASSAANPATAALIRTLASKVFAHHA